MDVELTRLTVNLVPNARRSLYRAAERTEDTKTDTVNRALQVYDVLTFLAAHPGHHAEFEMVPGERLIVRVMRPRWWHRFGARHRDIDMFDEE